MPDSEPTLHAYSTNPGAPVSQGRPVALFAWQELHQNFCAFVSGHVDRHFAPSDAKRFSMTLRIAWENAEPSTIEQDVRYTGSVSGRQLRISQFDLDNMQQLADSGDNFCVT